VIEAAYALSTAAVLVACGAALIHAIFSDPRQR